MALATAARDLARARCSLSTRTGSRDRIRGRSIVCLIHGGEIPTDRPRIQYQPALDGLRALAVGAVFAYHLGYPVALGGFLGVDTFFVLSGFLITSLLLAEKAATDWVSLRGFWGRRARRLLPAVFVMITVVCLYAATNVPSIQLDTLRGDAISSLFYFANWHFIVAKQSYFDLFVNPLPLNHLWSLAIEEQFYLLWPLLLLGLLRIGRRRALVIGTIAGIVASQIAMSVLYSPDNPSRAYYGTEARAHTLLIGCLLAMILRARPDLPARGGQRLQWLGVLALGTCLAAFSIGDTSATYFNGGSLAFAVVVAVLITAIMAPTSRLRDGFSIRPLRYVGRISYGIYLWHWPMIVFLTEERVGLGGNALNVVRILATFGVAAASFRLIEQPILLRRPRVPRASVLLPIGLTVVLASVFMGTAGAESPRRVLGRITGGTTPPDLHGEITGVPGQCAPAPKFEVRAADREWRRRGGLTPTVATIPQPRIAVFGDSRACSLLTGLEAGGRSIDARVANGAILGCGIVAGAIAPHYTMMSRSLARSCERRVNHLVDQVIAVSNPTEIVWYSGWEVDDLEVKDHVVVFGTPEHTKVLLDRMEQMYRRGRAPGRKLVILTMPEASRGKSFITADSDALGGRTAMLNDLYRGFAARHPDDVSIVDLARHVCPTVQPCPRTRDGIQPRAFDGVHFTAQGSAWAAKWLWPKLLAAWPATASK